MSYDRPDLYVLEFEHGFVDGEVELWRELLRQSAPGFLETGGKVLDIGAGTGLLSSLLLEAGCSLTCLDLSPDMTNAARTALAPFAERVNFVVGDVAQSDLFEPGSFDWIVSRQVLCHLSRLDIVLDNGMRWLRPGGRIFHVDGLWGKDTWGRSQLQSQPLASVEDLGVVKAHFEQAGFAAVEVGMTDSINALRRSVSADATLRYFVFGEAPPSTPTEPLNAALDRDAAHPHGRRTRYP